MEDSNDVKSTLQWADLPTTTTTKDSNDDGIVLERTDLSSATTTEDSNDGENVLEWTDLSSTTTTEDSNEGENVLQWADLPTTTEDSNEGENILQWADLPSPTTMQDLNDGENILQWADLPSPTTMQDLNDGENTLQWADLSSTITMQDLNEIENTLQWADLSSISTMEDSNEIENTKRTSTNSMAENDKNPEMIIPVGLFVTRFQPGGFAALSIDESQVAIVMTGAYLIYPLVLGWEEYIMTQLKWCRVIKLYCTGDYREVKNLAPHEMKVYLNDYPWPLKYPCRKCQKKCALTKAGLLWRRRLRYEPINLPHM